jgi:ubiquinone/menaquinone biosynthesis C-methylase UbiE
MLPAHEAYELWAATYPPAAHNPLMRVEQEVVEPLLAHLRATRALDVGTGSGRYLPLLRATGASAVLGIDFSLAMLRRADAARGRVCGDARHLPFPRSAFYLINASLMVGDIADLAGWAREMARVLDARGHLVYSDFHPSWAQRGWSRTFRTADGELHDLAFNAHTIEDHLAALEQAGLRARTIREPRFGSSRAVPDPSVRSFQRRWGNPPVVVVFHAVKAP